MLMYRFSLLVLFLGFCFSNVVSAKNVTWSEQEVSILRSLSLWALPATPQSPSNQYADNPQAQALGRQIFFDQRFSANGKISCASCHQENRYFVDGLTKAMGIKQVSRNTPTVVASAWSRWFYWDGRRDSLWSQALVPFEAADEMASSRMEVIRIVAQDSNYRQAYQSIFGEIPESILDPKMPQHAGPLANKTGRENWFRLSSVIQKQINRAYSNVGKAIAAYERTLRPKANRFDHYVKQLIDASQLDGQQDKREDKFKTQLSAQEIAGAKLFIDSDKTQCLQCHNGPLFSNGGFHNIGSGTLAGADLDFGRVLGLPSVLMDEFNCLGPYSDAKPEQCSALRFINRSSHIPLRGAYKTPSLRNVEKTAPYFHDGRFSTLAEVVEYYNQPPADNGANELKTLQLDAQERAQLVAFLQTLTEQ